MSNECILRMPKVEQRTGIGKSNIYKLISEGKFPAPIKLGPRASGWIESEISKWIDDKINESRDLS
jgi:prophage regulatory protein